VRFRFTESTELSTSIGSSKLVTLEFINTGRLRHVRELAFVSEEVEAEAIRPFMTQSSSGGEFGMTVSLRKDSNFSNCFAGKETEIGLSEMELSGRGRNFVGRERRGVGVGLAELASPLSRMSGAEASCMPITLTAV